MKITDYKGGQCGKIESQNKQPLMKVFLGAGQPHKLRMASYLNRHINIYVWGAAGNTIIMKRNKTITIWGNRGFLNYANIAKPGRL